MHIFKEGDRVFVMKHPVFKGKTGFVKHSNLGQDNLGLHLDCDNSNEYMCRYFKASELASVEPCLLIRKEEEKMSDFRLGDRVRIKGYKGSALNGKYAVVTKIDLTPRYMEGEVGVRKDLYSYMGPTDFHAIPPQDLTKEFCIGDRIRVEDLTPANGREGVILQKASTPGLYFVLLDGWPNESFIGYSRMVFLGAGAVSAVPVGIAATIKELADALIGKRDKEPELARAYGMSEKKLAERRRTVSATIILANGLEVRIPDPAGKDWVCTKKVKIDGIHCFSVGTDALGYYFGGEHLSHIVCIRHSEGKCWMKDMRRVIEECITKGPFDVRYAYVTELRFFEEQFPVIEVDDPAYPMLRAYLW